MAKKPGQSAFINCRCVDPRPLECAAARYQTRESLIDCLNASCKCQCHRLITGSLMTPSQWKRNREKPAEATRARLTERCK